MGDEGEASVTPVSMTAAAPEPTVGLRCVTSQRMEMDGGWRVVSLRDSSEQFQEFLHERLHLELEGAEGQPTITFWSIETIHRFD